MEMHQVRYFLAICEAQNFTRAAEACSVAQPSLTKAIKKLEDELGGELFRRERNQTQLTDLGQLMKPHLETIYTATEAAKADAGDYKLSERTTVNLGVMSTIGPSQMVGFISQLRAEVPSLDLNIREAAGRQLVESLLEGDLDIGLIGLPDLPDRLRVMPLYSERYTIAFGKGHRFEQMDSIPLRELDQEDYLVRVHCEFSDHFNALDEKREHEVNVRYSSEREDWIQAMVLARLGCCVMPEFLPTMPGIAMRPVSEPSVSRTISLVTVAGRRHSPALDIMTRLALRHVWPGG
ncbi:LysR family transcriptional regulator [Pelagibius sp. Alg239-R121]|uniref:LysR family transcriptional regulator n=1 Tax=Pelagibius sp. Alg239-R121 TaxID=2993448 RepID=UPI0024A6D258|nr:LysR family transcriptional regulator [Pelagibius sp. Alg239-R121]